MLSYFNEIFIEQVEHFSINLNYSNSRWESQTVMESKIIIIYQTIIQDILNDFRTNICSYKR
jgi:hypothetical protein